MKKYEKKIKEMKRRKYSELRIAADAFWDFQKMRIRFNNKLNALNQKDQRESYEIAWLISWRDQMMALEKEAKQRMERRLKEHPVWNGWLQYVHGVGPRLGGKLLGILDFEKAQKPASFYQFCGLGTKKGKAIKHTKGRKSPFSVRAKTICYQIGAQFLKNQSPYSEVYYRVREEYESARPDWTPIRRHRTAIRIMMRYFIGHLWEEGRKILGLEVREPYVVAYLGHKDYVPAEKFVKVKRKRVK